MRNTMLRLGALVAITLALGAGPALADGTTNSNNPRDVSAASVTTSVTPLLASPPVATMREVLICPTNGDIWIGGPNVTTLTGLPVVSGQALAIPWTTGNRWFARAAAGTVDVRVVPVYP